MEGAKRTPRAHQTHIAQTHRSLFARGIWTKSMLLKYKRCPEAFYQEFVLGVEPKPTWAMRLGNSMGDLMEEWGQRHLRGEDMSSQEAKEFLEARWKENMADLEPPEGVKVATLKAQFLALWNKFLKDHPEWGLGKLEGVEVPLGYDGSIKLGDVPIAGHPDQVWENAVVDIKTRGAEARALRVNLDWNMERVLYSVLTGKRNAAYLNMIYGNPPKQALKCIQVTDTHIDVVTEEVNSIVNAVKKGCFPSVHDVGNYPCVEKWCHFFGSCRKTKGVT